MKVTLLTLFPEMFSGPLSHSILKLAQEKKLLEISLVNIRDFGIGKHKIVDDTPYGGGVGMVMRVDVIAQAIAHAKCTTTCQEKVILLDPQGKKFSQTHATTLTKEEHLILLCPRYEGIDERVRSLVDEEISIGDYILTGGEIPALVIIDAVTRLLPGVLGKDESSVVESFSMVPLEKGHSARLLEYPQYTQPQVYNDMAVPRILLSGDHKKIEEWRLAEALTKTKQRRPDLLKD